MERFTTACLLFWAMLAAVSAGEPRCTVYRAGGAIVVDGQIDEKEWGLAPLSSDFGDITGTNKPAPPWRTNVRMLWDDDNFYIAAILEEPHVWATLTNHDAVIFQDNDFEMFIDPDGDRRDYYELEINALNTTWDLRLTKPYSEQGKAINSWEIEGLKTAVKIHGTLNNPRDQDQGWTIEMAIPWKALGEFAKTACPPKDGDLWPVNFSRVQWHTTVENGCYKKAPGLPEENWTWGPQGEVNMHIPERWPLVRFSKSPPPPLAAK